MTVDVAALRPAGFGRRNVRDIRDPIIEPMWRGDRVLIEVEAGRITVRDPEGRERSTEEPILLGLAAGVAAESVVIDAYLTYQATQNTQALVVGTQAPTAGEMATQMFVGKGLRARALRPVEELESKAAPPRDHPLAVVAVDLLALDGQSLLEIPLLERKRLLESVLIEGELVRRGAFVRPPVDPWLASWRSMGFQELAYKAANSRYRPGQPNDEWAVVRIPTT